MQFVWSLVLAGIIMGILDALWLGVIAKKIYYKEIGSLLLDKPNMPAALAFYVLYVIGAVVFVVQPALEKASLGYAIGYGLLFGLVAYATYDLTNLATLKNFSTKIVAVDLLWGSFITTTVTTLTYLGVSWLS